VPTQISIADINRRKPPNSRLVAVKEAGFKFRKDSYRVRQIECKCQCGANVVATPSAIIRGDALSCGCIRFDLVPKNKKYTMCHPKLKGVYYAMVDRCHNPNNKQFKHYGGRGVSVCDEWRNNPQSFFDWAKKGYKPGLTIDKDIIGDGLLYSPETCIWVTQKINAQNTSRSRKVVFKGALINISELERMFEVSDETIRHRIFDLGLSAEDAVGWTKWQRVKKRPILSYDEFKKKWVGKPLHKLESAGVVKMDGGKNILIDGIGEMKVDIFYLPPYDGWLNESQRHYFYMDARKVGMRRVPKKKYEWYVMTAA